MKRFCLVLLSAFFIFAPQLVHCNSAQSSSKNELVIGTTSGYAPFVSLNENGEYEGFDIDFCNLLAKELNKKLVVKDLGCMSSLLTAVQKNKIDAVIWAMSITPERQKQMHMIHYQGEPISKLAVIFWKKLPDQVSSLSDLAKQSGYVCVEAGSYQDKVLQNYPEIKLHYSEKILDAMMELKYGKAFAAIIDHALLGKFQEKYPEIKVLYLPLPSDQHALGNGVCINRSNDALASEVEAAIKKLKEKGVIAELEKKWNVFP